VSKHTIEICALGVDNPTLVQEGDTVVWHAESSGAGAVEKATITFTASAPFKESLSSPITISSGQNSSTYTVSGKSGKYPYNVVVPQCGTFSCDIQVVPPGARIVSTGPM
jgi:hypothetical protein